MKLYSIMPLDLDHADQICDDIERQYKEGIATEALFCMPLTPEGDPVIDKAAILCEKYRVFSEKLAERGLKCGILAQATIGHGAKLTTPIPFQPFIGFNKGDVKYVACPADESFRDYIRRAFATLAKEKPSTIMVDDDFRLFARPGRGCGCPIHMAEIERRLGRSATREELVALFEQTTPEAEAALHTFFDAQVDSLIGAAKAMREGIDSVDPTIPGAFCLCGDLAEGVRSIAGILAGKGNPVVVRIHNGRYCSSGPRGMIKSVMRAASQMALLRDVTDVFLAETDTCPQNRYSTAAISLHSHFTATTLEGTAGAKHWITRLHAYEPKSGEAYRKKLGKYSGFYRELSRIVPSLSWFGCCVPLSKDMIYPTVPLSKYRSPSEENSWANCVLERMGLPLYFSDRADGALFLDGVRDTYFGDDAIGEMLKGTVILAAESAKSLIKRGFGEYLGVDVRERDQTAPHANGEIIFATGQRSTAQMQLHELCPTSPKTEVLSQVFTLPDGKTPVPLFPGVTRFQNALGGTVVVFSGTPTAQFVYNEAFAMLNESRKQQLIDILAKSGNLPLYYPEDAEVYVKAARTEDGRLFCALFNVGLDPLDEIPLVVDRTVTSVRYLLPDGSYANAAFTADGNRITVDLPAYTLDPVILILE